MTPDDESEIRRIIAAQVEGWNRGDAAAWVAACEDDVGFTNIVGMRWESRAGSEVRHDRMFRGPFSGSRLVIEIERLRGLGAETAVAELRTRLTGVQSAPPGIHLAADGLLHTRMIEVFVRRGTRWRIAVCHNTAIAPGAEGTPPPP